MGKGKPRRAYPSKPRPATAAGREAATQEFRKKLGMDQAPAPQPGRPTKSQRRQARKNPTPVRADPAINPNISYYQFRASDTGRGVGGYGPGSGPMRPDGSWRV